MRLKLLGLAAAALIGSGPLALADVYTVTESYGPTLLSSNWGTSLPATYLALPGFNTSKGILTGVAITVTETITGSGSVTNGGRTGNADVTGSFANNFSVTLPGVGVITGSASYSYTATNLAHGKSATFNIPTSPAVTGYATASTTDNLSAYESQFVVVTNGSQTGVKGTPTGGTLPSQSFTDWGELTIAVQYSYNSYIPEPASLAIILPLLSGLAVVRRRVNANHGSDRIV